MIVDPDNSQIELSPIVLRQKMSLRPSPLKSPTPAMSQLRGSAVGNVLLPSSVPAYVNQIRFSPVDLFLHRMSATPSPSKSATLRISQLRSGSGGSATPPLSVGPSMNQMLVCPVLLLCQRMSDLPSPSRSAA